MTDVKGKWALVTGANRGKPVDILFNDAAVQIAYRTDYWKTPAEDYSTSKAALDKVTADLAGKLDGTDVCINLTDPGWCRTDLGGPNTPNDPDSVIPGIVTGAFIDDKKSGRNLGAQAFTGMTLEEAVKKAADLHIFL